IAQACQRIEARRIDRVGGDIVDVWQPVILIGEIGRVGEHQGGDQESDQGAAHAARAVLPDRGKGSEAEQDRKPRTAKRAEERRQRRLHLEESEADDEDRDEHRDRRKYREVTRPGGEKRHGLLLIRSVKPAGHCLILPVWNLAGISIALSSEVDTGSREENASRAAKGRLRLPSPTRRGEGREVAT